MKDKRKAVIKNYDMGLLENGGYKVIINQNGNIIARGFYATNFFGRFSLIELDSRNMNPKSFDYCPLDKPEEAYRKLHKMAIDFAHEERCEEIVDLTK